MNNRKNDLTKIKISLIINILITSLTLMSSIFMFTGFKFMNGPEPSLDSAKIGMLKYFTVQSNLFMGIVSALFSFKEIQLLKGKLGHISLKTYILKLMATTSVSLTFFVVFAYLGPISKYGIKSLLMNSNLFFHLIIPVLSMINFIVFEGKKEIQFQKTFYVIIPTILYEIYYLINVLLHMENGTVSTIYDWYWFVQNGVWTAVIVAPMMIIITYIIGCIIWKLNEFLNKKCK